MAENKINRSDIAEDDVFKLVTDSAKKSLATIEKYDAQLKAVALSIEAISKGAKTTDLKGINSIISAEKELNKIKKEAIENDRNQIKIKMDLEKLERERVKTETERIRQEKAKGKIVDDQNNAYKRLSRSTSELKAQSKQLGAQMLELEKSGKKNSAEYRQLAYQYQAVTRAAQQGDAALKKLDATVGDNTRKVGTYENALNKLNGMFGMLGVAVGGAQVVDFLAGNEIQLQRLQLALQNVMGTTEEYNKAFSFLTNLSKDYGQDLLVLTDTYKGFIAASESSGLVLEERNKIYQSVIKSGSSLALSNEQIEGALLAVSQMFSKGTVSAEELRGQLGERLPGAFGIMAKAVGVSEQELGKMMQKGEVIAKDVLPKFAVELEKSFGANANKNLQTIGGSWNVLKTNLMLYVNEANNARNATSKIASGLRFLAENIGTIVSVFSKMIQVFLVYKTTIVAINTYNKLALLGFKGIGDAILRNIPFTKQYTLAKKEMAAAAVQAGNSVENAGKQINAIPWAMIAVAVFEVGKAIWDIASGAKQAREDLARLNDTAEKATKSVEKNIGQILEQQRKRNEEIQNQLTAKKITQDQYLKLLKESNQQTDAELRNNKKVVNERKQLYINDLNYIRSLQKNVKSGDASKENLKNRKILFEETKRIAEKYKIEGDESWVTFFTGEKDDIDPIDLLAQLEANINGANVKLNAYSKSIAQNSSELNKNKAEIEGNSKVTDDNDKKTKKLNTTFKQTNEYLSQQAKLLQEINVIEQQRNLDERQKQLDNLLRMETQSTRLTGEIRYEELEQLADEMFELEKSYIRQREQFQIEQLKEQFEREKQVRLDALIEERDNLLSQEGLTADDRTQIQNNFNKKVQELESENVERKKDLDTQIEVIQQQTNDNIVSLEREKQQQINEINDELIEAQIDFYDKQNGLAKEQRDKQLEEEKKLADQKKAIAKELNDTLEHYGEVLIERQIAQSKRRQDIMQTELNRAKEREDQLREMANSGNLTAQQSLAKAEQLSIQRQQMIDRETRKQQALELAKIAYKGVLDFMEKGDSLPIATVKGATGAMTMQALFKSLFGFRKGTKRTVAEELKGYYKVHSGEDGYLAKVDPREKILNPELSAQTGDATTDEIVNGYVSFQKMQSGLIVPLHQKQQPTIPVDVVARKIDELKDIVKNKRELTIEPEIISGIAKGVIVTEKTGIIRNRTKYRA